MAWRLENSLIRGELFNLRPNTVHGWLELQGAPTLVHLGLTGNMDGELYGKRVQFETQLADDDDDDGEAGDEIGTSASRATDFEAIEVQQVGPTGTMAIFRSPGSNGNGEELRLSLQWFSQNGEMRIELINPRLEFVTEDDDAQSESPESAGDDGESVFVEDSEEEFPEFPDDADEDDPYGLFPPQLEEQLEGETRSPEIAAIDENALADGPESAAGLDDPLADIPFDERPKRSWDEVIPGIDEQTKRLYESWDEIFEGKKDVPLCTIFDPPLTIYPVDRLSDSEVESAFKVILRRLAMHSVALDMCEHFTCRDAYRLLVEEILPKYPVYPGLPLTGYVQHYSTWEYCRKCDEEFEAKWQAEEKERKARGEGEDDAPTDEIPF